MTRVLWTTPPPSDAFVRRILAVVDAAGHHWTFGELESAGITADSLPVVDDDPALSPVVKLGRALSLVHTRAVQLPPPVGICCPDIVAEVANPAALVQAETALRLVELGEDDDVIAVGVINSPRGTVTVMLHEFCKLTDTGAYIRAWADLLPADPAEIEVAVQRACDALGPGGQRATLVALLLFYNSFNIVVEVKVPGTERVMTPLVRNVDSEVMYDSSDDDW